VVTTAHIQATNMGKQVPETADAVAWGVFWANEDGTGEKFVSATSDGSAVVYQFGSVDSTNSITFDGATKGAMTEGVNGIVSIQVPTAAAKAGSTIEPYAQTSINSTVFLFDSDVAPDTGTGKPYKIQECPGSGGPAPAPAPGTGGGGNSAPVNTVDTQIVVESKSAKAAKKISVKLRSTGKVTGLAGTLAKGKKKLCTGKLASLDGRGTIKLACAKKPKKGRYTFSVTGKDAGNRTVSAKASLKAK
jgi:hypothetical protein